MKSLHHILKKLRCMKSNRCKKNYTAIGGTAGSGLDAGTKTLRRATLSLIYSTVEYCAPAWCRSAHTRFIDSVLNDFLRIVTGC